MSAASSPLRLPLVAMPERQAEEEADARRRGRDIDDRRRRVDHRRRLIVVAIGLIPTTVDGLMPMSDGLMLTLVALLLRIALVVIIPERWLHGYSSQHRGDGERQHDLADDRASMPGPCCRWSHTDPPFWERIPLARAGALLC